MVHAHGAPRRALQQVWLRALLTPVFLVLLVVGSAGRLDYWPGWLYIGASLAVLALTFLALRGSPELIEERLRPGQGMKGWDKLYFALSTPLYLATVVLAGLDVGRYGWSGQPPLWLVPAGLALFAAGQALFLWAKRANRFFSSVVRIQAERGQTVCRAGPYAVVRHPGYVGGLLFGLGTPLLLGSLCALGPALLAAALLVWRTAREDATLLRELPGYAAYAADVRFRLVPGVW